MSWHSPGARRRAPGECSATSTRLDSLGSAGTRDTRARGRRTPPAGAPGTGLGATRLGMAHPNWVAHSLLQNTQCLGALLEKAPSPEAQAPAPCLTPPSSRTRWGGRRRPREALKEGAELA
jgi:hypothetical protein